MSVTCCLCHREIPDGPGEMETELQPTGKFTAWHPRCLAIQKSGDCNFAQLMIARAALELIWNLEDARLDEACTVARRALEAMDVLKSQMDPVLSFSPPPVE
jgi:hypothetical protein